jgi:hypothetical protein
MVAIRLIKIHGRRRKTQPATTFRFETGKFAYFEAGNEAGSGKYGGNRMNVKHKTLIKQVVNARLSPANEGGNIVKKGEFGMSYHPATEQGRKYPCPVRKRHAAARKRA